MTHTPDGAIAAVADLVRAFRGLGMAVAAGWRIGIRPSTYHALRVAHRKGVRARCIEQLRRTKRAY